MIESTTPLSPDGLAKAKRILLLAQRAGSRRRRRRRCLQAMPLLLLLVAVVMMMRPTAPPSKLVPVEAIHLPVPPVQIRIERIATDLTVADRLCLPASEAHWQRLDDDRLLEVLAEAGRPAALAGYSDPKTLVFITPR